MDAKTLREMADCPADFRRRLFIMTATGTRRLETCMADFQREDFAALDRGFRALARGRMPPPHTNDTFTPGTRFWLERTKGASKDTDLAVALLWLLAFARKPLTCQVGAADQDQADELRKAALDIVRVNDWLGQLVEVQNKAIVNPHTGGRCDILTADSAGSHGARPHVVIVNELTHISRRDFAETLLDNAAKMPGCVVVIATNAGHLNTWQASWRENAVASDRWYFSTFTKPAPWLDPGEIEEARRRNSATRFARLWQGVWVSESGAALREDDIVAAVKSDVAPLGEPERGWVYYAGLDLGITRDASALAIVGRHVGHTETITRPVAKREPSLFEISDDLGLFADTDVPNLSKKVSADKTTVVHEGTGRYKLSALLVWRPDGGQKVSLDAIEQTILSLNDRFGLAWLGADPWQARQLLERIQKAGVAAGAIDFTATNLKSMATTALEVFAERQIDLYRDETLLADLRGLRAVEKSYGVRLESTRTSGETGTRHGDTATALAIALHVARQGHAAAATVNRPLLCWPAR